MRLSPLYLSTLLIIPALLSGCNGDADPTYDGPTVAETGTSPVESTSPIEGTSPTASEVLTPTSGNEVTPTRASTPPATPTGSATATEASPSALPSSTTLRGEVWADNWFDLYIGNELVVEDSVPITTERSFNAETFTFEVTYPVVLAFTLKDFKETDSGLEYIGENNQQMGDGGFIAQFTDVSTGQVVHVSSSSWRCLVVHDAPLNPECEGDPNPNETCQFEVTDEPDGWRDAAFDDSGWPNASVYTEGQVGPKDGYNEISWIASAKLIWGSDLETHNTLLCRTTVSG